MNNHPALEWVLRSLLRVRGLDDTEHTVTDIIRAVAGAEWTALYVEDAGSYALRSVSSGRRLNLPELYPMDALDSIANGRAGPVPVSAEDAVHTAGEDLRFLVPLTRAKEKRALVLMGDSAAGKICSPETLISIQRAAEFCAVALQNSMALETLKSQVSTDFLTGCHNRRGFDEYLRMEIVRARRYDRPLSLLLLDVDHFKWVNDGMGHQVGDHVLKRVGGALQQAFRSTDRVCRYGGDEFAIVFPETVKDEALQLAERLRVQLRSVFPDHVLDKSITVSLGVAGYPEDGDEPEKVLQSADRALYGAKTSGRDRTVPA